MLGIFNRMIRTSSRTQDWNPPEYWQHDKHLSTHERQRCDALRHREKLAREGGLFW